MRQTEIRLLVELDDENMPEKLFWEATDSPSGRLEEVKAASVSFWDPLRLETIRLDLWANDMQVTAMKRFALDMLGGMANTIGSATGDQYMADEMNILCEKIAAHLKKEAEEASKQQ